MTKPSFYCLLLLFLLCICVRAGKGSAAGYSSSSSTSIQDSLKSTSILFERLLCNYEENPKVISGYAPQFSWVIKASGFDRYQTAFRILVATTPEMLTAGKGDIWDSGKVSSTTSTHNPFLGTSLATKSRYYWKVKIWDEGDIASAWSPVQSFMTGLGGEADWDGAEWITVPSDERTSEHRFRLYKTGKMKEPLKVTSFPVGYFRKTFDVRKKAISATAYIVGLGYYELYLNGEKIGDQVLDPAPSNYDKTSYYVVLDATGV